jgi:hypothetical protein
MHRHSPSLPGKQILPRCQSVRLGVCAPWHGSDIEVAISNVEVAHDDCRDRRAQ